MLNDTYTIHDLQAAQLALHGKHMSAGSTPLPVELRVAEAIARARDEAAKGALHVSPEDRADVVAELVARVEDLSTDGRIARLTQSPKHAEAIEGRAARVRHLIALIGVPHE